MSSLILITILSTFVIVYGLYVIKNFFNTRVSDHYTQDESSNEKNPTQLKRLAEKNERIGNWTLAVDAWSRYIEKRPDDIEAYFHRGQNCYRDNQYQRSVQNLQHYLKNETDPNSESYKLLARCYAQLDEPAYALDCFDQYFTIKPKDFSTIKEAGDLAQRNGNLEHSKMLYEILRSEDSGTLQNEARLHLAEIYIKESNLNGANEYLHELEKAEENGDLTENQTIRFLYNNAQKYETENKSKGAYELYKKIYKKSPVFRNVKSILENKIKELNTEDLVKKIKHSDKYELSQLWERIVQTMGYEVEDTKWVESGKYEIIAHEDGIVFDHDKYLFSFTQSSEELSVKPVKSFRYRALEEEYSGGFIGSPGGFSKQAKEYLDSDGDITPLGSDKLLEFFKERELRKLQ